MEVEIGQVWEDCDSRMSYKIGPRRIEIIAFNSSKTIALVEDMNTGRRTNIRVDRLRLGSRGYRLVESP